MTGRFDQFHTLEASRRDQIIDAALAEFATRGYHRASTNTIVEQAGISKGMLFYYFRSKAELFDFICEYAFEFVHHEYLRRLTYDSPDFLERYHQLAAIKRRARAESPHLMRFLESFYTDENRAYADRFHTALDEVRETVNARLYADLDLSLFRADLDPHQTIRYLEWVLAGYEADLIARLESGAFDATDEVAIAAEWQSYFDLLRDLRTVFYRPDAPACTHRK